MSSSSSGSSHSNSASAARDAYASSGDPHASNDPYSRRDPYSGKSPHDEAKKEKLPSKYGYGHFCDQFFFIQDEFRDNFNSDIELHSEKRDYVGSGDLAAVIPLVGRAVSGSAFMFTTLLGMGLFFFMSGMFIPSIVNFAVLTIVFAWRFFCPGYLVYSSYQYVIGDRMRNYYKQYKVGFAFVEGMNIVMLLGMVVFIMGFSELVYVGGEWMMNNPDKFFFKNPNFLTFIVERGENIRDHGVQNMTYFIILYASLIASYYAFTFYVKREARIKRLINYRESFMRRLANNYQRKAFILDGAEIDEKI